jgi:hypothetical protein
MIEHQPTPQPAERTLRIAQRSISGLMGIADWMEETGHPRKANALRVHILQLDEIVGEWQSEREGE